MNEQAKAKTKLTRARATLILDQPFFGALALRLHLVEDENTKTMSVDGKTIRYNPDFVNECSAGLTKPSSPMRSCTASLIIWDGLPNATTVNGIRLQTTPSIRFWKMSVSASKAPAFSTLHSR